MITGTKQNPGYVTDGGVSLRLRPIKPLVVDRWRIEYKKQHPKPEPPVIELSNGDLWKNAEDEWYKIQVAEWEEEQGNALAEFLFSKGIKDDPPDDWQPILAVNGIDPRYAWVGELLSGDDIGKLMNAIMGIEGPTPEGIEEAEKKSGPPTEDTP